MDGQQPRGVISTPESKFHRETMNMILDAFPVEEGANDHDIYKEERQGFIAVLVDIQEAGMGKLPLQIPLSEVARVW
jgi:hypothetical protein